MTIENFLDNVNYRGLGWPQIGWAWRTLKLGVYQPMAWYLLDLQYVLFGLDPRGYHAASILMHAAVAVALDALTATILARTLRPASASESTAILVGSSLAAILFAVHPLAVEVVAWASCQPYLPSALFSLLFDPGLSPAFDDPGAKRPGWLAASWVLFPPGTPVEGGRGDVACGAGDPRSRPPAEVHRGNWMGRFNAAGLAREAPIPGGPERRLPGARDPREAEQRVIDLDPELRLALAHRPVVLRHCVLSGQDDLAVRLCAIIAAPAGRPALDDRVSVGDSAGRRDDADRHPVGPVPAGLLACWAAFLIILSPNMGLMHVGNQIAADQEPQLYRIDVPDRPGGLRAFEVDPVIPDRPGRRDRDGLRGLGPRCVLGGLGWRVCRSWRDKGALWANAGRQGYRDNPTVLVNLGLAEERRGRFEEAKAYYHAAIRLDPSFPDAQNILGSARSRGTDRGGRGPLHAGGALDPGYPAAQNNLGSMLARRGQLEAAIVRFGEAVRLKPDFALARKNLAKALIRTGRIRRGLAEFAEAARLAPMTGACGTTTAAPWLRRAGSRRPSRDSRRQPGSTLAPPRPRSTGDWPWSNRDVPPRASPISPRRPGSSPIASIITFCSPRHWHDVGMSTRRSPSSKRPSGSTRATARPPIASANSGRATGGDPIDGGDAKPIFHLPWVGVGSRARSERPHLEGEIAQAKGPCLAA